MDLQLFILLFVFSGCTWVIFACWHHLVMWKKVLREVIWKVNSFIFCML